MGLFMILLLSPSGRKAFLHFAQSLDNANLLDIETELRPLTMPARISCGEAYLCLVASIPERPH
jgi:hypothetical protein